jgi:dnd system-associated protein 4
MINLKDASQEKAINWRTIGIKRDRRFEALVTLLTTGERTIFKHIKDIMVFAAMIGYSNGKKDPIASGDTIQIILDTYATDNQDSFVYLLSLMTTRDGSCLKDENLHASVKVFEEYCNAGLSIMQDWMDENPTKDKVDIILSKIYDKVCDAKKDRSKIDNSTLELPKL